MYLSVYWEKGMHCDVSDEDIRRNIKWAAAELDYPSTKGIPIERVDTHSFRSGGANTLALSGYLDTQIQKMGGGGVQHSRSTFGRNWHATWKGCRPARSTNLALSILPAGFIAILWM